MTESTIQTARTTWRGLRRVADADILAAVVLVALSAVLLSQTGTGIRNWIFPRVLTYSLLAIAAVLVVRGLLRIATSERAAMRIRRAEAVDVSLFLVGAVAYVLLIPLVGFWLTSVVMLVTASVCLSVRMSARIAIVSVVVGTVVCVAAYLMFLHLFYVPLPTGWLLGGG